MRSKLFVPGSRPELFAKAMAGSADSLSFDLEDSVVPARKAEARNSVASFLASRRDACDKLIVVRVNDVSSEWFADDIQAICGSGVDIINVPKVESPDEIVGVERAIQSFTGGSAEQREIALLANIETPKGLRLAFDIASASPRVMGLQIGFTDFSLSCGIDSQDKSALTAVRVGVRFASAELDILSLDGAFTDIKNLDAFRQDAEAARRLGFAGKSCIHPTQVAIANEVFSPQPEDVARARSILTAADSKTEQGVGAFMHEGKMIDKPIIARARALVAKASAIERMHPESEVP